MALNLQAILNAPIIKLDTIDSTNNYAMQLIDADTAQHGMTIVSDEQTQGKGQRGKKWQDEPGQSVLMSLIVHPGYGLDHQFCFNMCVSLAIADVLQEIYENWDIRVKWPNDIIVNDKKAGGVLIENVIRGNEWVYSVVGLGLNVLQNNFNQDLPFATSLRIESGKNFSVQDLISKIRERIIVYLINNLPAHKLEFLYDEVLYRKGQTQRFSMNNSEFVATVAGVTQGGLLQLKLQGGDIVNYNHGTVEWFWG